MFMLATMGFAKTIGAIDAAWRTGKMSDKRGEKRFCKG
jgi:hypothetical protein